MKLLSKDTVRKAAIDASGNLIFWVLQVFLVIVMFTRYWSLEQFLSWLPAYLFLSFPFTPVFGRFLNWWRRHFKYNGEEDDLLYFLTRCVVDGVNQNTYKPDEEYVTKE